jgi:hypothetical protein
LGRSLLGCGFAGVSDFIAVSCRGHLLFTFGWFGHSRIGRWSVGIDPSQAR